MTIQVLLHCHLFIYLINMKEDIFVYKYLATTAAQTLIVQ